MVFVDEGNSFLKSYDFAAVAKHSGNYFVIVSSEPLHQLPYSVDEIYGLKNTSRATAKYPQYSRVYASMYRVYGEELYNGEEPDFVVVEDSNSGFDYFSTSCEKNSVPCESAHGKGNVYKAVRDARAASVLVIADGAAYGPHMELVMSLRRPKKVQLFLTESFECLILSSGLFNDNQTKEMLDCPSDFNESKVFFSWGQFFTKALIERTSDTYLADNKDKLKQTYLQHREFTSIVGRIPSAGLSR